MYISYWPIYPNKTRKSPKRCRAGYSRYFLEHCCGKIRFPRSLRYHLRRRLRYPLFWFFTLFIFAFQEFFSIEILREYFLCELHFNMADLCLLTRVIWDWSSIKLLHKYLKFWVESSPKLECEHEFWVRSVGCCDDAMNFASSALRFLGDSSHSNWISPMLHYHDFMRWLIPLTPELMTVVDRIFFLKTALWASDNCEGSLISCWDIWGAGCQRDAASFAEISFDAWITGIHYKIIKRFSWAGKYFYILSTAFFWICLKRFP